jgi:hypothetical protein
VGNGIGVGKSVGVGDASGEGFGAGFGVEGTVGGVLCTGEDELPPQPERQRIDPARAANETTRVTAWHAVMPEGWQCACHRLRTAKPALAGEAECQSLPSV